MNAELKKIADWAAKATNEELMEELDITIRWAVKEPMVHSKHIQVLKDEMLKRMR